MGLKNNIAKTCDKMGDWPVIGGIVKPRPKVAVIRMSGIIADSGMRRNSISHAKFEDILERAFDTHKLQAVALIINSPGGSPAQSSLLGNEIRSLAEEKEIPVYAFIEDVAASGGYWLACAADEIYAQPSSIVGSIGVISAGFGFQELIAKYGVERRVYTSGKDKGFLDPFQAEKPGDVKRLKVLQSDIHDLFIDWVKDRRGNKLNGADKDIFEGQFWTAVPAMDYGLIDGCGDLKSFCKDKFGEDIKFVEYGPEKGLISGILHGSDARLGTGFSLSLSRDLAETVEERDIWARYGL